jgi:hypothetical protein
MFRRRRLANRRREYERQPAADFLFATRPSDLRCADRKPGQHSIGNATGWILVAGNQAPYRLTRLDELRFSRADVPALTVTADPANSVAVAGSDRSDWSLRFCAEGEGEEEAEARRRLGRMSMVRTGGTVALVAAQPAGERTPAGGGQLVVDAPADATLVVHASYTAVQIRDMKGSVRVAATHARATMLNTTGQVDAIAHVIDFAGSGGRVILSAEAEINLKLFDARFDGTLLASAQRSVRILVPPGFATPFRAVVNRREDFVCRTEFSSRVIHEKRGDLHYFTYAADSGVMPDALMHLRSEEATVVIDTMAERILSAAR